jgi:hypothetical protein
VNRRAIVSVQKYIICVHDESREERATNKKSAGRVVFAQNARSFYNFPVPG